jgi:hypothetical protein
MARSLRLTESLEPEHGERCGQSTHDRQADRPSREEHFVDFATPLRRSGPEAVPRVEKVTVAELIKSRAIRIAPGKQSMADRHRRLGTGAASCEVIFHACEGSEGIYI